MYPNQYPNSNYGQPYNQGYRQPYNQGYIQPYNQGFNQPQKKKSGCKPSVNKSTGECFGFWGWCRRDNSLLSINLIENKVNKCKVAGFKSAFARVTKKSTGETYLVNALINTTKNIGIIKDMGIVMNPAKNYCGTFLKRK